MFCENCMSPLLMFVSFLMRLCLDQKDLHLFPLPFLLFSLSNNFSCSCPLNYFIGSKNKQVDPFSQLYWKKTSKERMFLNIWFLFFYWCLNGVWFWDSHCALCVCVCLQSLMNMPQPQAVLIASLPAKDMQLQEVGGMAPWAAADMSRVVTWQTKHVHTLTTWPYLSKEFRRTECFVNDQSQNYHIVKQKYSQN